MTTTQTKKGRRGRPTNAEAAIKNQASWSYDPAANKERPDLSKRFPKIAVYKRISMLVEESVTFERQHMEVMQFLKQAYGLDPELGNCTITVFEEEGSAYKNKKRPQFDAMIDAIAAGEYTHLASYEIERLFRNTNVSGRVTPVLERSGITVCVKQLGTKIDLASFEGKMQWQLFALMAEKSSKDTSDRQRGSMVIRAGYGVKRGGYDPLGLKTVRSTETGLSGERSVFAVDDEPFYANGWSKAQLVREMYRRVSEGHSCSSVMTWLNANNFPLPQDGEFWTSGHVKRIVTNPIYVGVGVHKKQPNIDPKTGEWRVTHEPLIDRALFDKVGLLVESRKRKVKNTVYSSPLSGLLYCADCGNRLYNHTAVSRKNRYRAFRCNTVSLDNRRCGGTIINAEGLEETIYDVTMKILGNPELAKKLTESIAAVEAPAETPQELELQAKITEYLARADKETDPELAKMFSDKAAEKQLELTQLRTRADMTLRYAKSMSLAKSDVFEQVWNEADKTNAQIALQGLYVRILISKSAAKYNWRTMRARGWKTDLNRITLEFQDGTVVRLIDFLTEKAEEVAA